MNSIANAVLLSCLALAPALALAQGTPKPDADADRESPGEFVISLGASYSTDSLGSGRGTRAKWGPLFDISYTRGRFSAGLGGIGYELVRNEGLTLSAVAGYEGKREEKDSIRLRGMGDVPGSAVVGLNADWELLDGLVTLSGSASFATRRANGGTASLGATLAYPLSGRALLGTLTLGVDLADKRHMQTNYGVTPLQAQRSGYRVFTPKAGLVSSSLSLGVQYEISSNWSAGASVGVSRREGDAAKSPLYTKRNEPEASIAVSYRF